MHTLYELLLFSKLIFSKGIYFFPFSLERTTDEVEHSWYLYSRGEFLDAWRFNFDKFQYTRHSPTRE